MRRWTGPIAIGMTIAFVALVAVLELRPGTSPSAAERSDRLAAELRCPDCQGLSVADSPTAAAREIRRQIDELVAGGATDAEVRAHFVERYGAWILLAPSAGITWLLPWVVGLAAVTALVVVLARRPARMPRSTNSVTAAGADRRRVHEEVDALDA
jgi:cytochrome c-type biogenesis protein CcmH